MATHSSTLAWRILWRGAWWATVYRVAESQTLLKKLSMLHVASLGDQLQPGGILQPLQLHESSPLNRDPNIYPHWFCFSGES